MKKMHILDRLHTEITMLEHSYRKTEVAFKQTSLCMIRLYKKLDKLQKERKTEEKRKK